MEIEIVEFYPGLIKKGGREIYGTLHAYVCDLDMDIRGIKINIIKGRYYVHLPFNYAFDEEGKSIRYPIIQFTNKEKNKDLHQSIRQKAKEYITENFFKKTG